MKVERREMDNGFLPFELVVTVESREEALALRQVGNWANAVAGELRKHSNLVDGETMRRVLANFYTALKDFK